MPTRFYLTRTTPTFTPATIRGAWDQTASAVTGTIDATKRGGGIITTVAIAETNVAADFDVLLGRWISGPLAAQTISGTINVCLGVRESAATADMHWHLHLYVTQGDTDTPRGTILTDYTEALGVNEWPSVAAELKALNAAQTLTGLAISAGDRIVLEIGYVSREASATSRTGTLYYGTYDQVYGRGDQTPDGTVPDFGGEYLITSGHVDFSVSLSEHTSTTAVRVSQAVIEVLSTNITVAAPCVGGGVPGTGTDPAAGSSLAGAVTPVVWITLQTDSGEKTYSTQDVGIDTTFREGRILRLGSMTRAFNDQHGGFQTGTLRVALADTDRVLAGLADSGILLNKRCDVYLSTAALIRAASAPRRVGQMIVRDFDFDGLTCELHLEDFFGSVLGAFGTAKKLPSRLFGRTDFPLLPDHLLGKPVPIGYGSLSDEQNGSSAVGVVPAECVGTRTIGSTAYDEYVLFGHAVAGIQSIFGSDLNETPNRVKLSPAIIASEGLLPGRAAWTSAIGPESYRDYNSRRYTSFFWLSTSVRSEQARTGKVPFALNVCGIEAVGDGTGAMIDSLPRQMQHLITQFMLLDYTSGNWAAIPTVGDPAYARVRSTSFETVHTTAVARLGTGYLGAFMLGWDGQAQTYSDIIRDGCRSGDFNITVHRQGQIMASMLDSSVSAVANFNDVTDMIKQSFKAKRKFDDLANSIQYRCARRYVAPVSNPTPAEGDRLPGSLPSDATDWASGVLTVSDSTSITNHAETRVDALDFPMVRVTAVADNVAAKVLARRKNGPVMASGVVDLSGTDLELGDQFTVDHFAGPTGSGWTDRPLRLEQMTVDLDRFTVELEGRDLTGL